jgi:hypothetical protein
LKFYLNNELQPDRLKAVLTAKLDKNFVHFLLSAKILGRKVLLPSGTKHRRHSSAATFQYSLAVLLMTSTSLHLLQLPMIKRIRAPVECPALSPPSSGAGVKVSMAPALLG